MVRFEIDTALLDFFQSGVQADWQPLSNGTVIDGSIPNIPDRFWTGNGANYSFIIWDGAVFGTTFGSSYSVNATWDYCNSNPGVGQELRLYYR